MARPRKHPREQRSERFNLRFTIAERAHIDQQAAAAGIDATSFLRRRALGYRVPSAESRADPALLSELNRIGVNVNQIARNLNAGRPERQDVDVVLAELRGVLDRLASHPGIDPVSASGGSTGCVAGVDRGIAAALGSEPQLGGLSPHAKPDRTAIGSASNSRVGAASGGVL